MPPYWAYSPTHWSAATDRSGKSPVLEAKLAASLSSRASQVYCTTVTVYWGYSDSNCSTRPDSIIKRYSSSHSQTTTSLCSPSGASLPPVATDPAEEPPDAALPAPLPPQAANENSIASRINALVIFFMFIISSFIFGLERDL